MITRLIMAFALALAECMARNMHNELLGAHAAVRPMRSGQGPEIIARVRHALD